MTVHKLEKRIEELERENEHLKKENKSHLFQIQHMEEEMVTQLNS
jgi:cell division protein FtsB